MDGAKRFLVLSVVLVLALVGGVEAVGSCSSVNFNLVELMPPRDCEDFGFDYSVAKWEWEGSWVADGDDMGTVVSGDDELAEWSVGTSGADGIVTKAGLWYDAIDGTEGIIDVGCGHDLSHILFCGYDEPECEEDVVFGDWSSWDDSECVDGWMTQSRTRLEYDDNDCGELDDVLHTETQDVECGVSVCYEDLDCGVPRCAGGPNYCSEGDVWQDFEFPKCINAGELDAYCSYDLILPWLIQDCTWDCELGSCIGEPGCDVDIVNGSWGSWENVSECVDGLMSQVRSLVEYDANSCGGFENVTHEEVRDVACGVVCIEDVVNESWGEWVNISGCVNGSFWEMRTMVEYDVNVCGGFENVSYEEVVESNCSVVVDDNCTADYYEDRYCSGDDVYKMFHDFSFVNGSCVEDVREVFVRGCSDDCDDGYCESDGNGNSNSWNDDEPVIYFISSRAAELINDSSMGTIELGGSDVEEGSLWWLWIVLLIILILILAWMIVRVLR